jgi:dihydroorotate dehydrogenase
MEKIEAGATLVQLYSGFIYHGPKLIEDINSHLTQPSTSADKSPKERA